MPFAPIPCLIAFCILFFSAPSTALKHTNLKEHILDLQSRASSTALHLDPGWLSLLHYRKKNNGYKSEADDEDFFLDANGQTNAKAELQKMLSALFKPVANDEEANKHAQCVFPARFYWIQKKLPLDQELLPQTNCTKFKDWEKPFNAHSLTLVFPAALVNGPSSMFGHTFIRVDPKDLNEKNRLLSVSINYAANMAQDEGQFSTIYKGIFGGFKGETSILPYHLKVKQYSDMENRDIWEYHLNFTVEETQQLIRHIWEVGFVDFNYYYIDENCAYRILAWLEAVKPSLDIMKKFSLNAIPAETIQALEQAGAIESITFRPSTSTQLNTYTRQMSSELLGWTKKLTKGLSTAEALTRSSLSSREKAVVLETAYEAIRYRKSAKRIDKDEATKLSFPLLIARSKISEQSVLPEVKTPENHSAQGHSSSKIEIGAGYITGSNSRNTKDQSYAKLKFRPTYHHLTDPWNGYTQGAQIEFLTGEFRFFEGGTRKLERFDLFNIQSFSPRKIYINPRSWSVALGSKRLNFAQDDFTVGFFDMGFGTTFELQDNLLFVLLTGEVQADNDLDKGFNAGPGIATGWIYKTSKSQGIFSARYNQHYTGDNFQSGKIAIEHVWNLSKNHALAVNGERVKMDEYYFSNIELGYRIFY